MSQPYFLGGTSGLIIGIGIILASVDNQHRLSLLRLVIGSIVLGAVGCGTGIVATWLTSPLWGWSLSLFKDDSIHIIKTTNEQPLRVIATSGLTGFALGAARHTLLRHCTTLNPSTIADRSWRDLMFDAIMTSVISILLIGLPLSLSVM